MSTANWKKLLLALLSVVLLAALAGLPWAAGPIGKSDFIGYWSASRLLLERRDPFDASALQSLQSSVYPERGYLVYAWNPPWALVLLLPAAILPFPSAAQVWLLINVIILAGVGGWLWYRITGEKSGPGLLVAVVASVLFPPSLAAIGAGQIVPWVLLATVVAIDLQGRGVRLELAGAWLIVAMLKPQVTFLSVALSAWNGVRRRQVRLFGGALLALAVSIAVVTLLHPGWLPSYLDNVAGRNLIAWQTPTLGGILYSIWPVPLIRYVGLASILAVPWLTRRWEQSGDLTPLSASLLLSVVLAPFGWSFDQILILPAVLQMIAWRRTLGAAWLDAGLVVLYGVPFAMRLAQLPEFSFVWVPWLALGLYFGASRRATAARLAQMSVA